MIFMRGRGIFTGTRVDPFPTGGPAAVLPTGCRREAGGEGTKTCVAMGKIQKIRYTGKIGTGIRQLLLALGGTALGGWLGQSAMGGLFPGLLTAGVWTGLAAAVLPGLFPGRAWPRVSDDRFWEGTLLLSSLFCGSGLSGAALQPDQVDYFRYFRMAGFLPWTDARGLYHAALEWPAETFSIQSTHRPLATVLDILIFQAGGKTLLGNYFLKACLTAAAVSAFIRALSLHAGRAAAWTAGSVLLYWVWPFQSMQLSEPVGIILSVLGVALLLFALAGRRKAWALWGVAGLVLAEMVRTANPLLVFALAFGTGFRFPFFRNKVATGLLLSGFAVVLQLSLSGLLLRWYGHPEASANSNSGSLLLGLARGKGWMEATTYVLGQHPEWIWSDSSSQATSIGMFRFDEEQVNREQWSLLLPTIRAQPEVLLNSLKRGFTLLFHQSYQRTTEAFGLHRYSQSWGRPSRWAPFYGGLAFLLLWLLRRQRTLVLLSALSLAVCFAFTPLVYADTGWRIVSTQLAGLAVTVALLPLGIRRLTDLVRGRPPEEAPPRTGRRRRSRHPHGGRMPAGCPPQLSVSRHPPAGRRDGYRCRKSGGADRFGVGRPAAGLDRPRSGTHHTRYACGMGNLALAERAQQYTCGTPGAFFTR